MGIKFSKGTSSKFVIFILIFVSLLQISFAGNTIVNENGIQSDNYYSSDGTVGITQNIQYIGIDGKNYTFIIKNGLIVGTSSYEGNESNEGWWNSNWSYCKNINVTGGDSVLNNFTIFVNVTYDANMNADFSDIRFVNQPCSNYGNAINYERDFRSNSEYEGAWILVPTLNTGVNQISMYYGNANASDTNNPSGAWDDYYKGVYHFSETSGETKDSKGLVNYTYGTLGVTGNYFGKAMTTNTGSGVSFPDGYFNDTLSTVELYSKLNNVGYFIIDQTPGGNVQYRVQCIHDGSYYNFAMFTQDVNVALSNPNDVFTYFAGVYAGTSNNQKAYYNGLLNATSANGRSIGGGAVKVWSSWDGVLPANITVDEFRFSKVNRSADWIKRSYDNANFSKVIFGEEQTV